MRRCCGLMMAILLSIPFVSYDGLALDSTRILIGPWNGKVTGPQGSPPTGDIVVTFEQAGGAMKGKIVVMAPGGAQYSGRISDIELKNKIFSATAIFTLGESKLETRVSGPLKGKTIRGSFTIVSNGQKVGEGTFSITKGPAPAPGK